MVPNLLFYQLLMVALVLICLLIPAGLPDHLPCAPQTLLQPDQRRRRRSKEPQPFTGSCTPNLRLIRQHEIRVEYPSFTTCGRGLCHGLRSLFLPAGADRPSVAMRHAPVGMAQRHRRVRSCTCSLRLIRQPEKPVVYLSPADKYPRLTH